MKRLALVLGLLMCWPSLGLQGEVAKKRLTIELVTNPGALLSSGISRIAWRPGANHVSYLRRKESGKESLTALCLYDVESGKERVLLDTRGEKEKLNLFSYQWSPKGDALLFEGEYDLWLLDVQSGRKRRLTEDPDPEEVPAFSPSGKRLAFVKRNNLYSLDLGSGSVKALTSDGNENVLNGKLDWVYEEELANRASSRAFQWSPDEKKIAFVRLDDGPVPQYPLTDYLSVHVGLLRQRFPQSGDPNPAPSFHVVAVEGGATTNWSAPLQDSNLEYIGPDFAWTPDSRAVSFLTLNRAQNELTVHLWDPGEARDRRLLTEKDASWINSLTPPQFLEDGRRFLWLSERDGWLHLYLYGLNGELVKRLTQGDWILDRPIFSEAPWFQTDEKGGWVYFTSTKDDPRERQLYRVRVDGTGLERLSKEPGEHSLNLSSDGHYILDTFSNFETPPETRLLKSGGGVVRSLDKPESHLQEYALGKTELVEVKAADGATLYARLVRPADFNPQKKYPVIIDVYGGPHVQVIENRWGVTSFFDHLLAQEGYLVWSLDNRGSWGRGHAWESVVFKDMGRHELEDQLAGVRYLMSLPYVDSARLGIWGWSYGGYMTLYALTHAPEVFKCGAAGGPVTDWRFYDSIYTERYMRTPKENPEGYNTSSPLAAAENLKAKLLLIHGTDDDNVHMQNTMNFMDALVKARKPFELYLQPGQKHGFQGNTVRTYLYERLLAFFKQNL